MHPTTEQLAALQRFRERHGRMWKGKLQELWMREPGSRYPDASVLRQIRNQLGPTWLQNFRFTEAS